MCAAAWEASQRPLIGNIARAVGEGVAREAVAGGLALRPLLRGAVLQHFSVGCVVAPVSAEVEEASR